MFAGQTRNDSYSVANDRAVDYFQHMADSAIGQDELNTCVLIGCTLLQKEVLYGHYNKSFIDQACLVKMAGYWAEKTKQKTK